MPHARVGDMKGKLPKLARPPIVEAIVELDCDLPEAWQLEHAATAARAAYAEAYPTGRTRLRQQQVLSVTPPSAEATSGSLDVVAYMFLNTQENQLVQVRADGFSFNRLAPYGSFDDYLPEIERLWAVYVSLAAPLLVRRARLRYVNRILLPPSALGGHVDDFLELGPRVPPEYEFEVGGFLTQYVAKDRTSENRVTVAMATEEPVANRLPVVLDIEASRECEIEPRDWPKLADLLGSLRDAKNRAFVGAVTERTVELFT